MRIRKSTTALAGAALLAASALGTASAGATPGPAAPATAKSCTPTWKLVPTPHPLRTVGSVSVRGTLGVAGSVSAVSRDDVWFPFGNFDPSFDRGYPPAWIGRWNGHAVTTPAQIHQFAGAHLWGKGGSFDSATDGWLLVDTTRTVWGGLFNYAEHWHGGRWTMTPLWVNAHYAKDQVQPEMQAVAALSPANAWAVGMGVDYHHSPTITGAMIEHWDGFRWSLVANPTANQPDTELQAVTAVSARDIWAVGYQTVTSSGLMRPLAEHWDGLSWTKVAAPPLPASVPAAGLFALSATGGQVWASGFQEQSDGTFHPLVEHFDGTAWHLMTGLPKATPQATIGGESIYAAGPDDVWTTAWTSTSVQEFLHWNGRSWSVVPLPGPAEAGFSYAYEALGGTGPDDVWAAGSLFDNGQPDITRNVTVALAHLTC